MELSGISKVIRQLCQVGTKMTGFNFIVADRNLRKIGNSSVLIYKNIDKPISSDSAMTHVIRTQRPVVLDRMHNEHCSQCEKKATCQVSGIVGVPIFFRSNVVGGIEMDAPIDQITGFFQTIVGAVDYLTAQADLIADVLEIASGLGMGSTGKDLAQTDEGRSIYALVDESGMILSHSKAFAELFLTTAQLPCSIDKLIMMPSTKQLQQNPFFLYSSVEHEGFWGSVHVLPYQSEEIPQARKLYVFRSLRCNTLPFEQLRLNFDLSVFTFEKSPYKSTLDRASYFGKNRLPMLICGSDGDAKNQIARWVHSNSLRRNDTFIDIDCSEIPIFDQVQAILGQVHRRLTNGLLWKGNKGTVYFKNVEYMSRALQKKLTALFYGTLSPTQYNLYGRLDVQFIFSSNKSFDVLLRQGYLDQELGAILESSVIEVPVLDPGHLKFPELIDAITEECVAKNGYNRLTVSEEIKQMLQQTPQMTLLDLQRIIELIVRDAAPKVVRPADIPAVTEMLNAGKQEQKDERLSLIRQMLKSGISKQDIAETLGISRATLYRDLQKLQKR